MNRCYYLYAKRIVLFSIVALAVLRVHGSFANSTLSIDDGGKRSGTVVFRTLLEHLLHGSYVEDSQGNISVKFSKELVTLEIGTDVNVSLLFSAPLKTETLLFFTYDGGDIIDPINNVTAPVNSTNVSVQVSGRHAGSLAIAVNSTSDVFTGLDKAFLRVSVVHSLPLTIVNSVIGWIYFIAWSISFYPQVIYNWRRKSVVGLNFDFLAYNLTGFLSYGVFNIGMYFIEDIKRQYFLEHPRGVNPVQLNDVVFTIHAAFVTCLTIFQCFIYERDGQRISRVAIGLLVVAWLFAGVTVFLAVGSVITWLTYVYYFSYIKLAVTLIKYIPQALMNFRRKSTEGWSIGNVLLDCTGGSFSILQMFLISYNNDDWGSIFGDPTKFGLGFFSICFDILFMIQHYCLYRNKSPYQVINNEDTTHDA